MKTAISLPDALFERIDDAAARLGLTRSAFFAEASERWLSQLERDTTTEDINRALEGVDQEAEMEFVRAAARALWDADEW